MRLRRVGFPLAWAWASLSLLLVAVVSGCATTTTTETPLRSFSGRFAAIVERGGERESASGRFVLAVYPGRTVLDVASPLGQTMARLRTDEAGATLTAPRADGTLATWNGPSPDALTESVLGYSLPVTGLPDWIAGKAVPGRPSRVTPDSGPVERIEQDGWVIIIDEHFDRQGAPRRLSLERRAETPMRTSLQLRLVLDATEAAAEPTLR